MKSRIRFFEDYENELAKKIKKKGLIITVDGLSGSGKSSVVEILMKEFGLKRVHPGGIFRENAKRLGITLEKYCETRSDQDDIETDKEVMRRALAGNVITDGRVSGWLLGDNADFRIYVKCPLDVKAPRIAKREETSVEDARKMLDERDSADVKRYRKLYGININDMGIYDFVVDNSGSFAELERNVKKIADEIRKRV